jgi:hypothetical protein
MASAAAPSSPAAWVARAAAPGNSDGDGAPVGKVPLPVGVGIAETELDETVVDSVSVEVEVVLASVVASVVVSVTVAEAEGVGVGVALASGIATVTPFWAQVSVTLEMTSASSAGVHDFLTQGVTAAKRDSAFSQWHLKSSRFSQPSVVRGVMKHDSCDSR